MLPTCRFRPLRCLLLLLLAVNLCACAGTQPTAEVPLQNKIGQLLMVGFRGLTLEENPQLAADLQTGRVGGVVLFNYDLQQKSDRRNIASKQQLGTLTAALQQAAKTPLLIAVDQEGGQVARLKEDYGFPATHSATALGGKADLNYTRAATEQLAATLAEVGINLNLAPVVDLCSNPANPVIARYQRCFSADPQQVTEQAATYIDAHHQKGVLTSLKHFPGHGSSQQDSHLGFTDISASWTQSELFPFRQLIATGRVDTLMTAHVFNRQLDPEHPATLSASTINGLLRDQLGFDGVVISDDLQMRALADHYSFSERIRLALSAGVDILLFGNNLDYDPNLVGRAHAAIEQLLAQGALSEAQIERSYRRVMQLKQRIDRQPFQSSAAHGRF